jgi:hypothetical protein
MPVIPEVRDAAEDPLGEGAVGVGGVGVGPVGPLGLPAGIMFTEIRLVGTAVGPAEPVGLAETEGDADGYLEVEGLAVAVGEGDVEGIAERLSPKQPQADTALS